MPGGRPSSLDDKAREFIAENAATMSDAKIAGHLKVSCYCVTKARQRMGIKKSGRRGHFRITYGSKDT